MVPLAALALVLASVPVTVAALEEGPWWFPTQGPWLETAHLTPQDADGIGGSGNPSHYGVTFGARVALDGDTLVAGTQTSFLADQGGVFEDGGDWAYIFERDAQGTWHQTAKLVPDDAHAGDTFAFALDIDEEAGVVVVGDPGANEQTNRVYIFERQADRGWEQTATFHRTNPRGSWDGLFGYGVAVSGSTVAAGLATGELGEDPLTYIFEKVDGSWVETATLRGAGANIDLAGDRLVGLFGERTSCLDRSPCTQTWAQVYNRIDGRWVAGAVLDPMPDDNRSQTLVGPLALSGDGQRVIMGSPVDCRVYGVHTQNGCAQDTPLGVVDVASPCPGAVGSAWIYEFLDGVWVQTADLPNPSPGPNDLFGAAVDVSGHLAIIGARGDTQNGADGAGAAYVYEKLGASWVLQGKLRNHDGGPVGGTDFFGEAVSVSRSTVIVGAPWDDQRRDGTPPPFDDEGDLHPQICQILACSGWDEGENAGSVYVFERPVAVG